MSTERYSTNNMDNKATVSGCIVTYNNSAKVIETIQSILEHTEGVELELYVVDNCSTDGTPDLIEKAFDDVTVIRMKRNAGFGAGHNAVLPLINSDFHAVINPDILFDSDVLASLVNLAADYPSAALFSPKIIFPDGQEQFLGKRSPTVRYLAAHRLSHGREMTKLMKEYCMLDASDIVPTPITNATGSFMFFRTDAFKSLGGFDERFFMYLEDCDIARRAAENGGALYVPSVKVIHLWERASKRDLHLLKIHVQSIIKYFLKWGIKF